MRTHTHKHRYKLGIVRSYIKGMYRQQRHKPAMTARNSRGSKADKRKKRQRKNKQVSAGCPIPPLEEDILYVLAYLGAVGGWE